VGALETGKHTLNLTINAVVTVGNENFPRSLNVLNRDIDVYITAPQRVSMFLSGNWQWLPEESARRDIFVHRNERLPHPHLLRKS
jgi:hypothetical protein